MSRIDARLTGHAVSHEGAVSAKVRKEKRGFQAGGIGQQYETVQRKWETPILFSKRGVISNFLRTIASVRGGGHGDIKCQSKEDCGLRCG